MWRRGRTGWPRRLAATAIVGLGAIVLIAPPAGARTPLPAGSKPSQIAKMICEKKAETEIGEALGVDATVSTPTWKDHLYACDYKYATGQMVLSVKELSSWSQTYAYFDGLAKSLHETLPIVDLGQGAFRVRGGSIVVRKDWKVLVVNIAGLPGKFGSPSADLSGVAVTVAGVIMACWHGD